MNNIKITVEYDVEKYIKILNDRRNEVVNLYGWDKMPDTLWECFLNDIRRNGIYGNTDPDYVVDNAIVNGDYTNFDDLKWEDETDEDFIKRMKKEGVYLIDEKGRYVWF